MRERREERLRVMIAGGGVAGLESALALRALAGDAVGLTMLTPETEFVYRPMTVREPFGFTRARRYPLDEIASDLSIDLVQDSLKRLDVDAQAVQTEEGRRLEYDALVLSLGARPTPRFEHALTIDDSQLDDQLHGLIQDLEAGYISRLALIAPSAMPWPLPVYELALMMARRAYDMNVCVSITIATPEESPLALFGTNVSAKVGELLAEHGIHTIPSAHCETPRKGLVTMAPGDRWLEVDRIVALPELLGPGVLGVPATGVGGFIPVDEHCRVRGIDQVWAAGDATDFPVKLGTIAAQQADILAADIAGLAGIPARRPTFKPEVHAVLLGLRRPLYLSAHVTGGHGTSSEISEASTSSPTPKITARYLAPYLATRDHLTATSR